MFVTSSPHHCLAHWQILRIFIQLTLRFYRYKDGGNLMWKGDGCERTQNGVFGMDPCGRRIQNMRMVAVCVQLNTFRHLDTSSLVISNGYWHLWCRLSAVGSEDFHTLTLEESSISTGAKIFFARGNLTAIKHFMDPSFLSSSAIHSILLQLQEEELNEQHNVCVPVQAEIDDGFSSTMHKIHVDRPSAIFS